MGRGRTQPDAITFYDVPAHEHNVILSTDRTSITPWVTHDERVLQFFGVTDQCVELYVADETDGTTNPGQGLAPNQWRIEYFNATGHVYINSTDLGKSQDDTLGYSDASAVNYPLEEASLYICRTPFYLQVCNAAAGPLTGIGGCDQGCEYFPAFTATDASLGPFTKHGRYDAACEAGDILSFNGLRAGVDDGLTRDAAADLSLTTAPAATPEIWFADGCQSENSLLLDGQEVHLYENFFGVMEVVIPEDVCLNAALATAVDAITFHKVSDDSILKSYTYEDLCMLDIIVNQKRFFVSAKKGVLSLCLGTCQAFTLPDCEVWDNTDTLMGNLQLDGSRIAIGPGTGDGMDADGTTPMCMNLDAAATPPLLDSSGMDCTTYMADTSTCGTLDDADFDADYLCCACGGGTFPGVGEAAGVRVQLGRPVNDDHIVATTGAVQIDGDSGNDILEDHNAEAFLIGNAGSDTLISRNGKDALWGGNAFGIMGCMDGAYTATDSADCSTYEGNPAACGAFDTIGDDPLSNSYADIECCICGGGSGSMITTFTATNTASNLDPDAMAMPTPETFTIGDQDTYVIYPTTDKTLSRMWVEARVTSPGNTKARFNECTKVYGFAEQDTLQFRLDDASKGTDECSFDVDGWELIWWLGTDEETGLY